MAEDAAKAPMATNNDEFLPGYPTVVSYTQSCFSKLVTATRRVHGLPQPGDDHEFYTSYTDYRDFCKTQGSKMLNHIGKLMKFQHVKCRWPSEYDDDQSMDTEDMLESIIEANDILLEQIDSCLDEASGIKKNKKPVLPASMQQSNFVVSSWNKNANNNKTKEDKVRFLYAKNILRPQLKFKDKPDNNNVPFTPIIKEKPNALRPLENDQAIENDISEDTNTPIALANFIHAQRTQKPVAASHPYQYEIEAFTPSEDAMSIHEPIEYKPVESTLLTYVDTLEKLNELLTVLRTVTAFAVDLEHHSFRSFQGFVCLMQISTREEDYLVDTLELRSELSQLNEVFTDPKILKVLHGADMDIGWLQRDFGIYVVNMFDTGQATRVLEYPRFSLAFLLKKFCDVTANKQYQLADWRIRPLPAEMELYAREDTHYLLYIYDRLQNELISKGNEQNNLIESVYKRSKDVCSKIYEKPLFTSKSYMGLYQKHKKRLNASQLEAFRLLYTWRDQVARLEDESYPYVLPNHMLFGIAEELPKAPQGVLACCNPVPTLVRQNINLIHRLVLQARDYDAASTSSQAVDPVVKMDTSGPSVNSDTKDGNDASITNDPMVPFKGLTITGPAVRIAEPEVMLFACEDETKVLTEGKKKAKMIEESFQNPFQAFLPPPKLAEFIAKKSAEEINKEWRKASDRMSEEIENEMGIKNGEKDEAKIKRKHESPNIDDGDAPLRQKKHKKNKEKNKKNEHTQAVEEMPQTKTQFVPFDYSSAKFQQGSLSSDKKDIFNPYNKKLTEKGKQFSSKVHMKSGQRSMTFGKKK